MCRISRRACLRAGAGDLGQDRIADGVERLCDQRRADDLGGIAGAERDHSPSPALRDRQRNQKAHQIENVLGVVAEADPVDGVAAHRGAVFVAEADRPAQPCVIGKIFRQRRRGHSLADIGLDQDMRFAVGLGRAVDRADEQRGMRPGRLRQVFDDAGNPVVALDQHDVAGLHDAAQMFGIARREWLIARHLLLKVPRDPLADGIEHDTHDNSPRRPSRPFCVPPIMVASRCNLVHASLRSIMIDSP